MTGVIFDCKRFAVHDGEGLRTTLFLKGCPLRCPWCQNPEGLRREVQLWHRLSQCLQCGCCAQACKKGAISMQPGPVVDRTRCDACGACVTACPAAAMELCGKEVSAEQAAALLLRDRVFFGAQGGVTLSGGEALAQPGFACEVLALCKNAGVDTAIETSLYAPEDAVRRLMPVTDHFLIDIKLFDPARHKSVLGVDNTPVLRNFELLYDSGADVLVRTPLIPGYTADAENLRAIARYLAGRAPEARYELLNFNPLCRSKYQSLGQSYPVGGHAFSAQEMDAFYEIVRRAGVRHIVKE